MSYTDKSKLIFPYEFLTNRKYRVWRHALLILAMVVISFNKAYSFYEGHFAGTGIEKMYIPAFMFFISYIAVIYSSIYLLIPKYFQSQKYGLYIAILLVLIALCTAFQEGLQYMMLRFFEPSSANGYYSNLSSSYIFNLCSTFVIDTICITGISVTVFLKHWVNDTEQVAQLEKKQMQIEVEHLKEQLNPVSLFDILNRAGNHAKKDKAKASVILMELSSVLQYQLYDCNRENVFIQSEIEFIKNYLELQKLCYSNLEYTISTSGNLNMILTPPLLFIPFVQSKINELDNGKPCSVMIKIQVTDKILTFTCCSNNSVGQCPEKPELSKIRKRLDILYPLRHKLVFGEEETELQLNMK